MRIGVVVALLVLVASAGACAPEFWEGFARGLAGTSGQELLVFGGPGHDTFLGCLTCSRYDATSMFNSYGSHGSQYSSESIYNNFSQFGSAYSTYSACNRHASDPPVVVDHSGTFYGRLTLNRYRSQAIRDPDILRWLENVVCK